MNAKSSSAKIAIVSAVGAAIILPLFFNPAFAVSDGSHFFVHAQDQDTPNPHEATAGLGGIKSDTGGSGETPTDGGDDTAALVTYTAGPVSLKITQAMLDLSAANVKAEEDGRSDDIKASSDGWKTIWFTDGDGNYTQTPSSSSADTTVFLSKKTTAPEWWDGAPGDMNNPNTVAYYDKRGTTIEGGSKLLPSSVGTTFYYKKVSGGSGGSSLKEGRYISEDGATIAAWVEIMSSGYNVTRTVSASNLMAPRSDTKPYRVDFQNGSPTAAEIFLKTEVDGYDIIKTQNSYARFGKSNGNLSGDGSPDFDNPQRRNGPSTISGSADSFDQLAYTDADGNYQVLGDGETRYTVADFNRASSMEWDGSFPKPSDFDTSKPFEPQG